ncbi:hypothetical protein PRJ_1035 [Pseudomonas sp. XWY-1]|nr:hypothetical protein PRJ_1035 [Pseudomonas sp. XWY-1]
MDIEPCRSGFTRECGGIATIAFAGKPAPTQNPPPKPGGGEGYQAS